MKRITEYVHISAKSIFKDCQPIKILKRGGHKIDLLGRSLFCTIWEIEQPLFSHWISTINRSKNIICSGVIFRNPPRSRDSIIYGQQKLKVDDFHILQCQSIVHSSVIIFFTKKSYPNY